MVIKNRNLITFNVCQLLCDIVIVEMAELASCPSTLVITLSGPEGKFSVRMSMRFLPLPPQSTHPKKAMEATDGPGGIT